MQYLITLIFIVVYIVSDSSLGYSATSPFYTHFTYMFQHAGWIHLILNLLAFIGIYRAVSVEVKYLLIKIIVLSFLASFLAVYSVPTVGASSMVYVMIGMLFALIRTKRMKIKNFWIFVFSVFLMLVISAFKQNSNSWLHVWCGIFGIMYIYGERLIKK